MRGVLSTKIRKRRSIQKIEPGGIRLRCVGIIRIVPKRFQVFLRQNPRVETYVSRHPIKSRAKLSTGEMVYFDGKVAIVQKDCVSVG